MLSSNLFQLGITFVTGSLFYLVMLYALKLVNIRNQYLPDYKLNNDDNNRSSTFPLRSINLTAVLLYLSIFISFLIDIGETYQYSYWYKRTFSVWGDGFPYLIIFFLLAHIMTRSIWLFILAFSSLLMSGGKVTILASIISMMIVALSYKEFRKFILQSWKYIIIAIFIYFSVLLLSNVIEKDGWVADLRSYISELGISSRVRGHSACITLDKCYETQINSAIKQRIFSSIGGAWMTLQGGYRGQSYPSSAKEFADLMTDVNPWSINDKYGITWRDWYKMGQVQNPYLKFGSGYGYYGLMTLLVAVFIIILISVLNIKYKYDKPPWSFLTIYLILVLTINQTQNWLESGSAILLLVGFCTAHVFLVFHTARNNTVEIRQ